MLYEYNKCDWCSNEITEYSLKSYNKKNFCDFVCARYYNDVIEKVDLNIDLYESYYLNNKLNKKAANIYRSVMIHGFEFMPIVTVKDNLADMDRKAMCESYIKKIYKN